MPAARFVKADKILVVQAGLFLGTWEIWVTPCQPGRVREKQPQ